MTDIKHNYLQPNTVRRETGNNNSKGSPIIEQNISNKNKKNTE